MGGLVSKWFGASYSVVAVIQAILLTSHLGQRQELDSHACGYFGWVGTCL
jgi:hypothetical protein